jgi:GT2 family glycosyltransferase
MSNLFDVSILLKTFLRDEKLFNSIDAIRHNISEVQMIIVDDGEMTVEKEVIYDDLGQEGHKIIRLPFDSGFGKKSNAGIAALDRSFLLISSDDFDHRLDGVKVGIETMLSTLDQNPELSIVSGRLSNRGPYEFHLVEYDGIVEEKPVHLWDYEYGPYVPCDVTVNFSLIRRSVFDKIRFDDEEIIGEGGHGAFFYDCKKAGIRVGWIPGVEISEQTGRDSERYRQFRQRACGPSRKCFEKRNIRKWVLGNGIVDYDVTKEKDYAL